MRFSLSPIVANLYLEHLEREAIWSAPLQPKLWHRYVDNAFAIWPQGQDELHRFHQHLNSQHPNIQFTMEEETDYKIAFLDVLVTRNADRLATSVYRKPTHTDRYIPFNSHHHSKTITGVMRGMKDSLWPLLQTKSYILMRFSRQMVSRPPGEEDADRNQKTCPPSNILWLQVQQWLCELMPLGIGPMEHLEMRINPSS